MRLKYQLFLAFLIASVLLIILMYAISSWSFSRGLLGYVNQASEQRAKSIVSELEVIYQEKQSWSWANRNSPEWMSIVVEDFRPGRRVRPSERRRPGVVLADAQKNILVGPSRVHHSIRWLEINSDNVVVGYLGVRQLDRLDSQLDRAFEQQQKNSFAYAGLAMAVLCALLAVPMASFLVKPLLRIGNVVELMRQGIFTERIPAQRKDELGELAHNINQLSLTLEQNRDSRQRWIAEISHELRTPMAVLLGEIEAMQDGVRPIGMAAVDSLHTEVMRLNRLVDDLHTLSLSDIGALDCKTEALILDSLILRFLEGNSAKIADASLTLTCDLTAPGACVQGDTQRLQQLFSNLLQNSLRYTDAEGGIVIETRILNKKTVQLLWSDSSPGVPADALPKLFDPLFRVEQSRSRVSGGSGLGLCIVNRIVKAHKGSVELSASELGGLQIDIRLPLENDERLS